jgi:hypothetical protein
MPCGIVKALGTIRDDPERQEWTKLSRKWRKCKWRKFSRFLEKVIVLIPSCLLAESCSLTHQRPYPDSIQHSTPVFMQIILTDHVVSRMCPQPGVHLPAVAVLPGQERQGRQMHNISNSAKPQDTHGSECGRNRPGFGWHAAIL